MAYQKSWQQYSSEELDRQYSPSKYFGKLPPQETLDDYERQCAESHKAAMEGRRCELDIQYMPGGPALDIYYSETDNHSTAVLIYLHGGGWEMGSKEDGCVLVSQATSNNVTVVAMGYDLVPKVNMATIVEQCRTGCIYVAKKFPGKRLYVSGHSAGGHLTMMLGLTNWSDYGADVTISGLIPISGVYDLGPIQKCYMNGYLKLTDNEMEANSPVVLVPSLLRTLPNTLIVVGELESEEFKRQMSYLYEVLNAHKVNVTQATIANEDHFTVVTELRKSDYSLTKMILDFIAHIN